MLYSKNKKDKKLDIDLFKNPTSDYRATPFWAWNCELERDELCRQIDIFKEMGYGGYHMHARAGLSDRYLGDKFMNLVKACVEHGKEKGMLSWLYDEDRCPSGFAGGLKQTKYRKLMAEKPEFAVKHAVVGMLPKGPLGRQMARKLRVYAGAEHEHAAQMPTVLELVK